jgi:hypothetical protein
MWSLEAIRWIVTGVFGILGGCCIIGNYAIVIRWYLWRKRDSLIPLVGGIFLVIAMLACPLPGFKRWAWLPLVLDLSVLGFLYSVFVLKCFKE